VKKPATATPAENIVRQRALQRVAELFGLSETSLFLDARFGHELKADPVSDFKTNQFDILDRDIKDVADQWILKEMAQGKLVIQTVVDYCEHMVRCSRINPEAVVSVLRLPQSTRSAPQSTT
jgi:hypothetical protein